MNLETMLKPLLIAGLLFNFSIKNSFSEIPEKDITWTKTEKTLFISYLGLSLADAYQTSNMPKHLKEINPLIYSWAGRRPNLNELILYKGLIGAGLFYMCNKIPEYNKRDSRKYTLILLNSIQIGVCIHNENISRGILFKKTF